MSNHTAIQFKSCICSIVCSTFVRFALFINTLRYMGGTETEYSFYFAKQIVQNITPVAKHVNNDSAIVFFPVVPTWALGRNRMSFKNPIAKFTTNRKNFSKEIIL